MGKKLPVDCELSESTLLEVVALRDLQCPDFAQFLTSTGDTTLVENTPDPYWHIGKNKDGRNVFGKMLMQLKTLLSNPNDNFLKYLQYSTVQYSSL